MKTFGERAIEALARHERAAGELARIKKSIVGSLEKCPITIEAYKLQDLGSDQANHSDAEHNRLWDGSRVRHHLHEALTATVSDYCSERRLDAEEITDQLTGWDEDSEGACPHCLMAWSLIRNRTDVRRELGIAKRTIRALGKSAMKVTP